MKSFFGTTLQTSVLLAVFVSPFAALRGICLQVGTSPQQTPIANVNVEDEPTDPNQVRIVRLSEATAEVDVYRQTGNGYERAMLNLPILEGTELRTGKGFAEVEFEDNSLLHLAPNTIIEFPRLELSPSGSKITTVNVERDTVYVNLADTPGNEFTLTFAHQKAALTPSSHVRLLVNSDWASLSVLDGDARVETPTGETAQAQKKTVNFQFLTPTEITQDRNADGPYDE
jgi:hypothetical protein